MPLTSRCVRTLSQAIAAALLLAGGSVAQATDVTIIHVNDTHSHLDAVGPKDLNLDGTLGGLAKAATVIGILKATEPNPLLVHAGDMFQGDLYFYAALDPGGTPLLGLLELAVLSSLGFDVMALGNHELALGPSTLAGFLGNALGLLRFSGVVPPAVISANVDLATAGLTGLVQPNEIREIAGVRVGFFGMTARDFMSQGSPFLGASPDELVAIASVQVADLRARGADAVVCLSHLGLPLDRHLAGQVAGIDAIVGGHDHLVSEIPDFVRGPSGEQVPIVRAGEFYKRVGKLTLSVEDGRVTFRDYWLAPVDALVPRAESVASVLNELETQIDELYGQDFWHESIAFALEDVKKDSDAHVPQRDTGIGNLVADALRAKTGTDIAMTVTGFAAESLSRGHLVRADAFRIVGDGFDPSGVWTSAASLGFPLYRIAIDGANLLIALGTSAAAGRDFLVQVSGMRYVIDSSTNPPSLLYATVGGEPVDPARVYSATVNLGVLSGLSMFPNVTLAAEPVPVGVNEYAAVADWMVRVKVLLYFPQGRVLDVAKL